MLSISRYKTDPTTVSHLLAEIDQGEGDHRAAFDLTFSAPMSFSLAYAAADAKQRNRLLGAHRQAVNLTLVFLEASMEDENARTYSQFEHLSARYANTMVHTHVLVGGANQMELYPLREDARAAYITALAVAVREVLGADFDLFEREGGSA